MTRAPNQSHLLIQWGHFFLKKDWMIEERQCFFRKKWPHWIRRWLWFGARVKCSFIRSIAIEVFFLSSPRVSMNEVNIFWRDCSLWSTRSISIVGRLEPKFWLTYLSFNIWIEIDCRKYFCWIDSLNLLLLLDVPKNRCPPLCRSDNDCNPTYIWVTRQGVETRDVEFIITVCDRREN